MSCFKAWNVPLDITRSLKPSLKKILGGGGMPPAPWSCDWFRQTFTGSRACVVTARQVCSQNLHIAWRQLFSEPETLQRLRIRGRKLLRSSAPCMMPWQRQIRATSTRTTTRWWQSHVISRYNSRFAFSTRSWLMKWNESGFRPPLCTYRLNWARRTSWGW